MIKEYKIMMNRHNKPVKMATIMCDNCKKDFDVPEIQANEGRRYCSLKCNADARHFKTTS